ncbi:hypothetical protein AYO20_11675 [Fonsecaea nubica]|uniref:Zn(2)-C6 fungal-type domain-containing protein n=1 Tax=Fonsecaea nubica TaxID=856822 RepID=A0A178BPL1_9EURO|nr:hypothetical protein AYO20_11675 [Fonsecaea nubica]OAL19164.1 hypothetical protein AYO20_11675 [Fonsecaea nubica]
MSTEPSMSPLVGSPAKPASQAHGESDPPRSTTRQKKRSPRRASIACVACRKRKIKCDGDPKKKGEPCLQCKHLSRPCIFRMDDRRKMNSTSKAYIKRLQDRLAALQESQGNPSPTREDDDGSSSGSGPHPTHATFEDVRVSLDDGPTQAIPAPSDADNVLRGCSNVIREQDPFAGISNYQMMDWQFDIFDLDPVQSTNDQGTRSGAPPKSIEARNYMISQLYAAMGQLDGDEPGQIMNLNITSILPPSSPEPLESATQALEELADSKDVQKHLLDLYFMYPDPLLQVLLKEPFMSVYAAGVKTQYFSKLLLYSVLLNALRLSSDPSIRHLDRVYLKRVREELVLEMENPTISTIQALCIFADYRGSGLGHDKACLLYAGIAFRMLYDLGLNRDGTDLLALGYISERDLQVRHDVFWGCYVYDKFYSIYLGRPSTVKLADATVPRPSSRSDDPQLQTRVAWCDLCMILSDVIDMVNYPSSSIVLRHQSTIARLSSMSQRLLQWLEALPIWIRRKPESEHPPPPPGVYALHMQFYTTIIMLHRPFAAYTSPSSGTTGHGGKSLGGHTPALSRQVCNENAIRFSKLLLAYREHYGVEKIYSSMLHMIFIAATTLISQISTDTNEKEEGTEKKKWLAVCLQALNDLTPSFHIAGRVHRVIASFLEGCGYSELAPLAAAASGDTDGKMPDQQSSQRQGEARRRSRQAFPTNSLASGSSGSEDITDPTLAVDEYGLRQALQQYHTTTTTTATTATTATYPTLGGMESLLNLDSFQTQSVFPDFEKADVDRLTELEMNYLCT